MKRLYCFFYVLTLLAVSFSFGACSEVEEQEAPQGTYRFVHTYNVKEGWYETNAIEFNIYSPSGISYYIGQSGSQGPRDYLRASETEFEPPYGSPERCAKYFFDKQSKTLTLDFSGEKKVNPYAKQIKSIKYNGRDNTILVELKEKIPIFGDKLSFKLIHKEKSMWDGMDF